MQHGEFSSFLKDLNRNLIEAQKYGSNDIQKSMITDYVEHFDKGDMEKHKKQPTATDKKKLKNMHCPI